MIHSRVEHVFSDQKLQTGPFVQIAASLDAAIGPMLGDDLFFGISDPLPKSPQILDDIVKPLPHELRQCVLFCVQHCNHLVQPRNTNCRYNTKFGKGPLLGANLQGSLTPQQASRLVLQQYCLLVW